MTRARPIPALVALVVLCAALGACTGGSDDDACGLVTEAEAARILDTPVREPEADDESLGPESSCAWISRDSTREPEAPVYGFFVSVRDDEDARREFARRRTGAGPDLESVAVQGLGDDAYFLQPSDPDPVTGTSGRPVLYVRDRDSVVLIGTYDDDAHPFDADQARRMQRAVARTALPRL